MGPSGAGLVWPWDQRERVVSALTSSIQNGADVRNAQAGHLIVEQTSGEVSE